MTLSKQTTFYGSQVGGSATTPYPYTGSPWLLLQQDIASAFSLILLLPYIVFPLTPLDSGPLCELYPSAANLYDISLHLILIVLQLPFVLSVPFWVLFPVWWVLIGIAGFWAVNEAICYLLNGKETEIWSTEGYAERKRKHEHEQWIFLNGVAVGHNWLQNNVDRLALTFGRPVLGVHNRTNGVIFDVIQCLIQRNFTYATQDVRDGYRVIKRMLYDPRRSKVVFILHSQGGIEGGMIIDWLLQEVPQDLLAKLEVYTFGNAANHFNNPHLHLVSQHAALSQNRSGGHGTIETITSVKYRESLPSRNGNGKMTVPTIRTEASRQKSPSGKTIRYIEHYAHTLDFVARWGVLNFTSPSHSPPSVAPRFMGRVFEREGKGHQMNMHYLDAMFPLARAPRPSSPPSSPPLTAPSPNPPSTPTSVSITGLLASLTTYLTLLLQNLLALLLKGSTQAHKERGGIANTGFLGCADPPAPDAFMNSPLGLDAGCGSSSGVSEKGSGSGKRDRRTVDAGARRESMEVSFRGTHAVGASAAQALGRDGERGSAAGGREADDGTMSEDEDEAAGGESRSGTGSRGGSRTSDALDVEEEEVETEVWLWGTSPITPSTSTRLEMSAFHEHIRSSNSRATGAGSDHPNERTPNPGESEPQLLAENEERSMRAGDRGQRQRERHFKVKDMSRLWLYRNGRSPEEEEGEEGEEMGVRRVVRVGTI